MAGGNDDGGSAASEEDLHDDGQDSMLDTDEDSDDSEREKIEQSSKLSKRQQRELSNAPSTTSTNIDFTLESLVLKFPKLFTDAAPAMPKILITMSLNSTYTR